jgi:hypothetical protein
MLLHLDIAFQLVRALTQPAVFPQRLSCTNQTAYGPESAAELQHMQRKGYRCCAA